MIRNISIAAAVLLAAGAGIASQVRIGGNAQNGRIIAFCPIHRLYIERAADGVPAGFVTLDAVADGLMNQATVNYTAATAGNPFAGLGFALIASMREPVRQMTRNAFDDACAGRSTDWLSNIGANLSQAAQ